MDAAVPESSTGRAGAVVLVSGGLDSAIALKMLVEQGVPVTALHFVSVFSPGRDPKGRLAARTLAEQFGVPLLVRDATEALLGIVPNPRFGWGRHVNPCMDCHAYHMSRAKALFAELGASFVATGEVLGQRPMSQNLGALGRVEEAAGLDGLVLRPLSAKCLEPTIPEQRGWVDRERLLAIKGRSRAEQNRIAKEQGITGFTTPAGGCLLTDAQFAWKLQDLLNWDGRLAANDVHLLKLGRHFRLGPRTRAIVGRNERENAKIVALRRPGDWILVAAEGGSPETLLREEATPAQIETAARLTAAYSRQRTSSDVAVDCTPGAVGFAGETLAEAKRLTVSPADGEMVQTLAIRRPGGDADRPARSGQRS